MLDILPADFDGGWLERRLVQPNLMLTASSGLPA